MDVMVGIMLTEGASQAVTGIATIPICVAAGWRRAMPRVCRILTQARDRYGRPEGFNRQRQVFRPPGHNRPRCCSTVSAANRAHPPAHRGPPSPTTGKIEASQDLRASCSSGRRFDC